jgi:hypothetical protein
MTKVAVVAALVAWLASADWLVGASVLVLALSWIILRADEGPPVLALAVTLQWVTVSVGLFYVNITGRPLEATLFSDYRPMVLIGLTCLVALSAGLYVGRRLVDRRRRPVGIRPDYALTFKTLVFCYAGASAVVGAVHQVAWQYPSITQAIIALTYLRLGLLYLVLRRLVANDRWLIVAGVLVLEVGLGVTGFYAGFREPLIMAVLAYLERFDRRRLRHWVTVGALAVAMCALGVIWVNVRVSYRERFLSDENFAQNRSARFDSLAAATRIWAARDREQLTSDLDAFIDRLWAIYYPALAVRRVPNVLPHSDGKLMLQALQYVFMPRIFFPDKPDIGSDSELVRKYSGVMVAGDQQDTNIAFGYAAESYVDFGIPLMFVPVFLWGTFMGVCYAGILRTFRHRDIAVAVATVVCWLSLYLFERSWAKTIGLAGTLMIYLGGVTFLLDRLWYEKWRRLYAEGCPEATPTQVQASPLHFQPDSK